MTHDYTFYLYQDSPDAPIEVATPGIDLGPHVYLCWEGPGYQIWHIPSQMVWSGVGRLPCTKPASYKLVAVYSDRATLVREIEPGHKVKTALAALIAEAERLSGTADGSPESAPPPPWAEQLDGLASALGVGWSASGGQEGRITATGILRHTTGATLFCSRRRVPQGTRAWLEVRGELPPRLPPESRPVAAQWLVSATLPVDKIAEQLRQHLLPNYLAQYAEAQRVLSAQANRTRQVTLILQELASYLDGDGVIDISTQPSWESDTDTTGRLRGHVAGLSLVLVMSVPTRVEQIELTCIPVETARVILQLLQEARTETTEPRQDPPDKNGGLHESSRPATPITL